jgi:hypothetical protein
MCLLKVNARSRVRRNKLDRVAGQQASRVAALVSQLPSWVMDGARPGKVGRPIPPCRARWSEQPSILTSLMKPNHRLCVSCISSVSLFALFLFLCLNCRTRGTLIKPASTQRPVIPPFDQADRTTDGLDNMRMPTI